MKNKVASQQEIKTEVIHPWMAGLCISIIVILTKLLMCLTKTHYNFDFHIDLF